MVPTGVAGMVLATAISMDIHIADGVITTIATLIMMWHIIQGEEIPIAITLQPEEMLQ